ncbi:MAG: beta-ketoacyl-[acyl-carrier-protein] synthase II, partial [Lachnospiraceae bacterium]|nr:beta-ketoacyl-[acyl-carrier-protein] synthase II [Lachnospiraceae bacterium]
MCRVVITGMGVVSPVGNDIETFWKNITSGVCGIDRIKRFDASGLKVNLDAEVKDFDPKKVYDTVQEIRKSDLYMQYAMAA